MGAVRNYCTNTIMKKKKKKKGRRKKKQKKKKKKKKKKKQGEGVNDMEFSGVLKK